MSGERKLFTHRLVTCFCLGAFGLVPAALGQTYATFKVNGAQYMYPQSINRSGAITGYSALSGGQAGGFVRDPSNTITTFGGLAYSINDKGDITGSAATGFVRAPDGTITAFTVPESTRTIPQAINADGTVAGAFYVANGTAHGFVRYPNGLITTFDPSESTQTIVASINAVGAIAGSYNTPTGMHGFVREPGGTFILFDAPGRNTRVTGINVHGTTTGWYNPAANSGRFVGFVRSPQGKITSFDPGLSTQPWSINDEGWTTGETGSGGPPGEGFVRNPGGKVTVFNVPGCADASTHPRSINDLGAVTGWCFNVAFSSVGFVRLP
jgi:hypothetical protein